MEAETTDYTVKVQAPTFVIDGKRADTLASKDLLESSLVF